VTGGTRNHRQVGKLALGIDIGSKDTKIVVAEQSSQQVDILGAASLSIPADWVVNGQIVQPKAFAKLVSAELASMDHRPTSAVISIPSALATLRWITLPTMDPEERREAARFKVKRHLPFPVEEAYIDTSEPIPTGDGSTGQSLVIAVRREVIDSRAVAIEYAGLQPVGAELEAQAVLRVVERRLNQESALWRDASLTIVDIGGTNTHMYVVQNQRLQFIRGVKFGAETLAHALAQGLDIAVSDGRRLLGDPNTRLTENGILVGQAEDGPIQLNIEPEMTKLTKEFLRLLRYFRSLHPERSYAGILDHMVICGGLAGLAGIAEYLQARLGLRVERARPFSGTVAQLNLENFQSLVDRQEAFTVVMGLALAGLQDSMGQTEDSHGKHEFVWCRAA
jgi:type IV pilus assembly protein PilM